MRGKAFSLFEIMNIRFPQQLTVREESACWDLPLESLESKAVSAAGSLHKKALPSFPRIRRLGKSVANVLMSVNGQAAARITRPTARCAGSP